MRALITGVTGSLGSVVLKKLLDQGFEVVGLSRDEQKHQLLPKHINFTPYIGDIRDLETVRRISKSCDYIFHFAALKCVDVLERNIYESISTNIDGTKNIYEAFMQNERVNKVIFTSTDKSVFPINVYGSCKSIAERIILQSPRNVVCRYGNVIASRGSAVPYFIEALKENKPINVTHESMSRFWITIDEAADFVISCMYKTGVQIPPMKAAKVVDVIKALAKLLDIKDYSTSIIGIRPGEKIHEDITFELDSNSADIQYTEDELIEKLRVVIK